MADTRVRTLTAEQSQRLLSARRAVPAGLPADLLLRQAASYLASILGAAVVFAGWRDGRWSILARSSSGAELRLLPDDDFTLDEVLELLRKRHAAMARQFARSNVRENTDVG